MRAFLHFVCVPLCWCTVHKVGRRLCHFSEVLATVSSSGEVSLLARSHVAGIVNHKNKPVRGFWDGSSKCYGRSCCGVVITVVDRNKWITISNIAVPLGTRTSMTAEVVGLCVLPGHPEPFFLARHYARKLSTIDAVVKSY